MVQKCESCQYLGNKLALTALHPFTWPTHPWPCLHIDFAGPILVYKSFLIIVDAHSKWLEVIPMMTTTAERTITELRRVAICYPWLTGALNT